MRTPAKGRRSAQLIVFHAFLICVAVATLKAQAPAPASGQSEQGVPRRPPAASPAGGTQTQNVQRAREVLLEAEAEFKGARIDEALRKCREAIELDPQAAGAQLLLGMIQDRRGVLKEARQALLRSSKLDPSFLATHIYLGRMYLRSGKPDQAAAEFQAGVRLGDNGAADAHYGLGLALNAQTQYEEALPNLRAAVASRPAEAPRLFALGQTEVELARLEDIRSLAQIESLPEGRTTVPNPYYLAAISHLEQALAGSPTEELSRAIEMDLGVAYSHSGRDGEAARIFQKLLRFWPESPQLHFNLGVVYGHLQRYSEAVAQFHETLKLKSDDDNARLAVAHVYLSYGQFKDAIPYLRSYIQHKPANAHAYELLGRAYRRQGLYSEAVEVLRKGAQLDPQNYEARYDLGASLARLGHTEQAIEQLQEAKRLRPDGSEAAYELGLLLMKKNGQQAARGELEQFGQLKVQADQRMRAGVPNNQGNDLMKQGRVREAVAAYEAATRMDPGNAPFHYNLALAQAKLGDRAGEQRALQQAIKADPGFAKAHNQLGLSYLANGRQADAEKEFKKALEISPEFAEAENNLGVLYGRLGNDAQALLLFQKAAQHSPQYVDALANLGLALADQGKYEEARRTLQRTVTASPQNPGAYTALGMIAATTGRSGEASQYFRKATELQPSSSEAHINLGNALKEQFNFAGALKEFSEAVRLAPESALAHYNRGRLLYDAGNHQEAQAELETARRLSPDDPRTLYLLALAAAQMNNFARSAELLKKLVQVETRDSDAQELLGEVLLRLGKTTEAIEHWQAALDVDPNKLMVLYDLSNLLGKLGRPEASNYARRLDALERRQQLTDLVLLLDHFSEEAARTHNWPEAVAQLQEAQRLCGACAQAPDLHRDLGLIYCRQGRIEDGRAELRMAAKLKPDYSEVLKTLQVLESIRNEQETYHE
jgi:tetratricopeptide (TPR) repeat protein